jgi:alpha-maltose-1-phosphate synthase
LSQHSLKLQRNTHQGFLFNNLHVAFLTNEYPIQKSGGIGTSIRNLAVALVAKGHRVTVLFLGNGEAVEHEGVEIRFVSPTRIPKLGWLLNRRKIASTINQLIENEGLEIVEAPDWCGLSAGIKINCPIVIRCNGSATYFGNILDEPVRNSVRLAEQLALRSADSVAAVSSFTAEMTQKLFSLNEVPRVVSNGIDLGRFSIEASDQADLNTILYFGTLVRKKGFLDLAEIFNRVVVEDPNARLRIIGRDASDSETGAQSTYELFRQSLSEDADRNVEYLGSLPYSEMSDQIRNSTLCVFPSYAEAMPLAWLEAMAVGKAVIAYDIGWAPEAIEDGVSGELVPLGDVSAFASKILELIGDKKRCEELGRSARKRVDDRFSNEVIAGQSLDWYKAVIREYSARRSG